MLTSSFALLLFNQAHIMEMIDFSSKFAGTRPQKMEAKKKLKILNEKFENLKEYTSKDRDDTLIVCLINVLSNIERELLSNILIIVSNILQ